MCGRYALTAGADELVEAFDVPPPTFELMPRYNICPGQLAPVVATDRHGRRLGLLTWGLVPGWADEPGRPLVNVRSESLASGRSYREAFDRRRCLIPADGFYEWKAEEGGKVPHWIHPAGGGLLSFGGIWEHWRRPGAEPRHTFAVLTTRANAEVTPLHRRMPVVIRESDRQAWLDRDLGGADVARLLRSGPDVGLAHHPVSTRVNRAVEDDPELIAPVG